MPASFTGTSGPVQFSSTRRFVHGQGWSTTQRVTGSQESIEGLIGDYKVSGWDVDIAGDGSVRTLTATKVSVDGVADNSYYDRFTMSKENIEKSIWTHEEVQSEGAAYASLNSGGFQEYKKKIEEAVEEADTSLLPTFGGTSLEFAQKLYTELSRGAESFEDEYTVLTRERVVGLTHSASPLDLRSGNISKIYTQSQFQSVFGVPDFIGITWPNETSSIQQAQWGWRSRKQEVQFLQSRKIQIVQDWAHAQWSTFLYTPYA